MANADLMTEFPWAADDQGRHLWDLMKNSGWRYKFSPTITWVTRPITHEDLTASATTQAIVLNTLLANQNEFPANVRIEDCWIELITAFSGGSLSSMTVQLGDTTDPNELIEAEDVFTGVSAGIIIPGTYGVGLDGQASDTPPLRKAAYEPELLFTGSHNVDTATAGSLRVCIDLKVYQAIGASD